MPTSRYERAARRAGYQVIAGLDEAGRGALFGPVFAAAVVLDPDRPIRGLDDSKQLAPERRDVLATRIRGRAFVWAVAAADAFEIDRVNILEAARLAMQRAVSRLNEQLRAKELGDKPLRNPKSETDPPGGEVCQCDYLLVDAVKVDVAVTQKALIRGDALCFSIAAASILAKVERDAALTAWDRVFPEYGLAHNKGYATPEHIAALERFGPTTLHRFSFEPVRNVSRYETWTGYPLPQQGELFACL